MKELICVNIGQAGVQISNSIWELMCLEHSIGTDGKPSSLEISEDFISCDSMFMEVSENKFVPRCLSVDLEPTVIDEIRTGVYRNLFGPMQLISGLEDSSNNFARGHYIIGKIYLPQFLDVLRKLIQLCDCLQGFMIIQSFGGGCGSGFTSLVMEQISIEYGKRSRMQFSILPSSLMSSAIVEPYNTILSSKICIETTDLCLQHDNQSIYNVFEKQLEVTNPSFNNINRLLAQVFSSLTVSIRYENALNNDIDQIATNLIPFPRLHYPIDIYSPICNMKVGVHCNNSTAEITRDVFRFTNKLIESEYMGEKFMSCCLQYRGNVYPSEVNRTIIDIKKNDSIMFVDWCPTGYKIGISRQPSINPKHSYLFDSERSLLLLSNNTCFHQKIGNINTKFDILFSKRSFIHWFVGEGMEESEFVEGREEFAFLEEDYKSLALNDDADIIVKDNIENQMSKEKQSSEKQEAPSFIGEIYEYVEKNEETDKVPDEVPDFKKDSSKLSGIMYSEKVSIGTMSKKSFKDIDKVSIRSSKSLNVLKHRREDTPSNHSKSDTNEREDKREQRIREFLKKDEDSMQSDISTI